MVLMLSEDGLAIIKWWPDSAFAAHKDMMSHTDRTMTLGHGSVYIYSTKQKLFTRSLTKVEIVGAAGVLPQQLYTNMIFEAQSYVISSSVIFQGNQGAIHLEQNGCGSGGKRTRHMDVMFFFITDRVEAGEIMLEHCLSGEMRGDFFSKLLQGNPFKSSESSS
eukprot:11283409-Ditylum_brightwellii.AAC.1